MFVSKNIYVIISPPLFFPSLEVSTCFMYGYMASGFFID